MLTKNNRPVTLHRLQPLDRDDLYDYLQHLGDATRKRFGPHAFDWASITRFYHPSERNTGYIARSVETGEIVAYAILKSGFLEHDAPRLRSYGLQLSPHSDSTFAPSVADAWQSEGLGNMVFQFILDDIRDTPVERIILWGGVQSDNEKAVGFYRKNGFVALGQFRNDVLNDDMVLYLR